MRELSTWAHRCQAIRTCPNARTWAHNDVAVEELQTAGDILRNALAQGEGKRTIARRLAGQAADAQTIERWRAVVVRAERGGEPNEAQAETISDTFEVLVRRPPRRPDRPSGLHHRLEAIERLLVALHEGQTDALNTQEAMKGELAWLRETLDARLPAQPIRRLGSR